MKRKPVMVFGGEFWSGASGAGLAEGFRELGWAVQDIDYRHYGAPSGKNLPLRLASRLTRRFADKAYQKTLVETCRELKPDIFLTIKGSAITSEVLRRIRETGARTVMYYPDFHFEHPGVSVGSFAEYDLFITTKTFQVEHLERMLGSERVAYVPHGFCDRIHRPIYSEIAEKNYMMDALYIGSHSAYKQQWLTDLMSAGPDLDLHIAGPRWKKNTASGPLARCKTTGERVGSLYAAAIQTARINIAIHFGPTAYGWEDKVSTRTFEIPACKGFMLHIDNDEVREFFDPGREIDVFSSPGELHDKISFYLKRPDLRAAMIERAYARSVPAYGYSACAAAMDRLMTKRLDFR